MFLARKHLYFVPLYFSHLLLGQNGPERWEAPFLETPPVIDGVLDDPAWKEVTPISNFRQVEPMTGGAPSVETVFYVAYDAENIYFAVVAADPNPAGIVATQLKRDADLTGDDTIVITLDPFLNQRDGYYFAFNPLGAQRDALIRGGDLLNTDWDGVWKVEARRTAEGWVAEGAIPISTLSFKSNVPAWGLNIERVVARTGERIRWNGFQRQFEVNNLANAGRLEGLTELRRASKIELRPFVSTTYSYDKTTRDDDIELKPGFDLFYNITESTTAVLTINTDFADAEVDDRVVNLSRFPVRFPEKRAFFLQDAGVFSYSLINNNPLPYYSRRIGLGSQGQEVDIYGGVRISGREGPVNFGLLTVATADSRGIEAKQLSVGRVLFNLSEEVGAGIIATHGDPRTNGDAWLAGVDLNYTTGNFLGKSAHLIKSSLYYQETDASGRDGDSRAFGWGLIYDSPTWGFVSYLDRVGEDYYPALGRVSQTGVTTVTAKVDYEFNPAPFQSVVPSFFSVQRHSMIYDLRELLTYGADVTVVTQRGDRLLLRVRGEEEILPEPFTVGNGVVVLPGDFQGVRYEANLSLSASRPISATLGFTRIPYFGGDQTTYSSNMIWRPSPLVNFDAGYDYTSVELPYAKFPVRLIRGGARVQFSKNLVWSTLGQYDNISETVGFNTRLRWTYAPGSDVFLVFNQGVDTENDRWEYTISQVSAKVTASYRF